MIIHENPTPSETPPSESNEVGGDSISVANEVGDDNSVQNLDEAGILYKSIPQRSYVDRNIDIKAKKSSIM